MKRTRHITEHIVRKLKIGEQMLAQGKTVAEVCLAFDVFLFPPITAGASSASVCRPMTPSD